MFALQNRGSIIYLFLTPSQLRLLYQCKTVGEFLLWFGFFVYLFIVGGLAFLIIFLLGWGGAMGETEKDIDGGSRCC